METLKLPGVPPLKTGVKQGYSVKRIAADPFQGGLAPAPGGLGTSALRFLQRAGCVRPMPNLPGHCAVPEF